MSFFELLIVFVVGALFLDYQDIFLIIRKMQRLKNNITAMYHQVQDYINEGTHDLQEAKEEIDEINSLLKEITDLGGEYKGDYSLRNVRNFRQRLQVRSKKNNNC